MRISPNWPELTASRTETLLCQSFSPKIHLYISTHPTEQHFDVQFLFYFVLTDVQVDLYIADVHFLQINSTKLTSGALWKIIRKEKKTLRILKEKLKIEKMEMQRDAKQVLLAPVWLFLTDPGGFVAARGTWMCFWLLRASGGSCWDVERCSRCSGRRWSPSRCCVWTSSRCLSRASYHACSPSASP